MNYETIDSVPPNVVIDVQTNVYQNQRVEVSWSTSNTKDVRGYNIYRSSSLLDQASYKRLNENLLSHLETTFNDTLATSSSNNIYYYRVSALDDQGNESPLSTAAMALLQDIQPPPSPKNLQALFTANNTVELTWDYPDLSSDFYSFIVLRYLKDPFAPRFPSRVNRTTLLEPILEDLGIAGAGFKEGAEYAYEVISVDKAGNFSSPASVDITISDKTSPEPPNGVQVFIDNASRISVLWNPSPSLDVMSYVVYRSKVGSTHLQATPVSSHVLRYEDITAEPGTTYEYWVTAADFAGNESVPSPEKVIQMKDFTAPRHVRNVSVLSTEESGLQIQWEPVPSFDLAGYRLYSSNSAMGEFSPVVDELITTTRWVSEESSPETWYKVFAIDTSGNMSSPSRPVRASLPTETTN